MWCSACVAPRAPSDPHTMLTTLKQARAAVSLLSPDEVRRRARRQVRVGLVASGDRGYSAMEAFLLPLEMPREARLRRLAEVYRANAPDAAQTVDLVLYEEGIPRTEGTYTFREGDPQATVTQILEGNDELALALARTFPPFRKPAVERIIHAVSRENALFAIATALPNILPGLLEVPWALGEFASDIAFLTANQIRMAFLIAAACGKEAGFAQQKAEVLSIVAGAFGWRAIARELVGKIPLGGGLIPKGVIAFAGTMVVGKSLEYWHRVNAHYTREQRDQLYQDALEHGKAMAESLEAANHS